MKAKLIIGILCIIIVLCAFVQPASETAPYELRYPPYFGNRFTIPENNPMTREGVILGRHLFYETKLSRDNKISCATCHQQSRAFTDGRAFSEGFNKALTKRSSMSLANLLWVRSMFWDGRIDGLEAQAITPLTDPHEMAQSLEESVAKLKKTKLYPSLFSQAFGPDQITGENILKALAQFERTLISANAKYDQYLEGKQKLSEEEMLGMTLFMRPPAPEKQIRGANCGHCHGSPKTFIELFHNTGLDSIPKDPGRRVVTGQSTDDGRFRVPTLRNIALTAPYMHDGRFQTLEQVLDQYNEHVQNTPNLSPFIRNISNELGGHTLALTTAEKKAIISFLHTLTDSTFIHNPEFSNPHVLKH